MGAYAMNITLRWKLSLNWFMAMRATSLSSLCWRQYAVSRAIHWRILRRCLYGLLHYAAVYISRLLKLSLLLYLLVYYIATALVILLLHVLRYCYDIVIDTLYLQAFTYAGNTHFSRHIHYDCANEYWPVTTLTCCFMSLLFSLSMPHILIYQHFHAAILRQLFVTGIVATG